MPLPDITDLSDDEPQKRGSVTTGRSAVATPSRPPVEDTAELEEATAKAKAKAKAKSKPVKPKSQPAVKPEPAPKGLKRPAAAKASAPVLKRPASAVRAYKYWYHATKKIGIKFHGKEITTV